MFKSVNSCQNIFNIRLIYSIFRHFSYSHPHFHPFNSNNVISVDKGKGLSYRMFFFQKNEKVSPISPWHDIPLFFDQKNNILYYVNEIPKGTRRKMEIFTKEKMNPIKQDVKDGKLRVFKSGNIPFNYGALPQTWEDPFTIDEDTKYIGDNDPLDVVEISNVPIPRGRIVKVRLLGCIALIDQHETDWKIITINIENNKNKKVLSIKDLGTQKLSLIREWFRSYKIPEGKEMNRFAFNEEFMGADFAKHVIIRTHRQYLNLLHLKNVNARIVDGSLTQNK